MIRKHTHISIGLGFFFAFLFFSYLVHKNLFTQFDFNTTVHLQDDIPRRFDQFFSLFSFLGEFEVMTTILVILLLTRRKIVGLFVIAAYVVIHLIELYGKFFVSHHPPPHFMLRTQYPVNFPQFYVSTQNSYPSGHAARTIFVSLLIFFVLSSNKRMSKEMKFMFYVALFVFDGIMLVSRAYLGEHWTSDLIGGTLLGAASAFLVKRWV